MIMAMPVTTMMNVMTMMTMAMIMMTMAMIIVLARKTAARGADGARPHNKGTHRSSIMFASSIAVG